MKKFIIMILIFIMFQTKNYAQSFNRLPDKFLIGYEVGIPSNDFISNTSWRGGRIEYRRMINSNISVGFSGSWNSFEQYVPKTTYQKPDGSGAITADIVKDLYSVPLTVNAHYYFTKSKNVLPYVGLGLGTMYSDQTIYANIYGVEETNWGFAARPEVGLVYPFTAETAVYFSAVYNYASNKNETFNVNSMSHIALSIGFVFSAR
jgi:outer membrane protein